MSLAPQTPRPQSAAFRDLARRESAGADFSLAQGKVV